MGWTGRLPVKNARPQLWRKGEYKRVIYIDFDAGFARLNELYDLPFDNIALAQQRQFGEKVTPMLTKYPTAHIAYFGFAPIPVAFHFGYLLGEYTFSTRSTSGIIPKKSGIGKPIRQQWDI